MCVIMGAFVGTGERVCVRMRTGRGCLWEAGGGENVGWGMEMGQKERIACVNVCRSKEPRRELL